MNTWVRKGILWGGILYMITMIGFPVLDGETLSIAKLITGIFLWIAVGLSISYLLKDRVKAKAKSKSAIKKKR